MATFLRMLELLQQNYKTKVSNNTWTIFLRSASLKYSQPSDDLESGRDV